MVLANTVAYYDKANITSVKSFIIQHLRLCVTNRQEFLFVSVAKASNTRVITARNCVNFARIIRQCIYSLNNPFHMFY